LTPGHGARIGAIGFDAALAVHRCSGSPAAASTATQTLARLGQRSLEGERIHRERTAGVRLEPEHDPAAFLVKDSEQPRTAPELHDATGALPAAADDDRQLAAHVGFGIGRCLERRTTQR